jgi:hypothetical protein
MLEGLKRFWVTNSLAYDRDHCILDDVCPIVGHTVRSFLLLDRLLIPGRACWRRDRRVHSGQGDCNRMWKDGVPQVAVK